MEYYIIISIKGSPKGCISVKADLYISSSSNSRLGSTRTRFTWFYEVPWPLAEGVLLKMSLAYRECCSVKNNAQLAGLHDHFNRGRLSIEAFFQPIFFHFENFLLW